MARQTRTETSSNPTERPVCYSRQPNRSQSILNGASSSTSPLEVDYNRKLELEPESKPNNGNESDSNH
jgi:hypothetical protein